jgi:hypothetical protein
MHHALPPKDLQPLSWVGTAEKTESLRLSSGLGTSLFALSPKEFLFVKK